MAYSCRAPTTSKPAKSTYASVPQVYFLMVNLYTSIHGLFLTPSFLQMVPTSLRLQPYLTDQGTPCVYSPVTGNITAFCPLTQKPLGSIKMAPHDVPAFQAHGLPANVSNPIGYFLIALASVEPPLELATVDNVPAEVWALVLKSCAVPTVIPET